MVIQKFNKLIRNKWVWGVFAVAVSAAFCFDDLFTTREREERQAGDAGLLAGERVDAKAFVEIAEDVRGIGRQRDWHRPAGEVNREAWETYAALSVADKSGLEATDAEVREAISRDPSFQANGGFSFALYDRLLRENSVSPERFEAFLKRRLTMQRIDQTALSAAAWVSPMELDQAVADMTDTFTVRVAKFEQTKAEADAVKVDDAALKAWYDKNSKSLELPERVKVRTVRFSATDPKVLAKMNVTTNEMHDLYDTTVDKYTTTDTNGVEHVKAFEEVAAEIEKDLRRIAAVQFFETNLIQRAYAVKPAAGSSRLDEIAKEEGATVSTSDWFAPDGPYQEGFMTYASRVCPGAKGFVEAVAELDSDTEDLRYAVVSSDRDVWLVEKAETSPKHTPTFEEAKEAIRPRALRDAKADAFKAKVEAVAKGGTNAVEAVAGCSTNITFCVADIRQGTGSFEDMFSVARAATKLSVGEVSEFTPTGNGKAILVVCKGRVPGDAAKAIVLRNSVRNDMAMSQVRLISGGWRKWNLERLGFEPGDVSSVETGEAEE